MPRSDRPIRSRPRRSNRGVRWIKNPAAISPVWREKPERIAALAMLTVVGLLMYALIQRQVRQSLQLHAYQSPGNKGETAHPTAAVVLASFAPVTMAHFHLDDTEVRQLHGWQEHQQLICDALRVDYAWDRVSTDPKNTLTHLSPPWTWAKDNGRTRPLSAPHPVCWDCIRSSPCWPRHCTPTASCRSGRPLGTPRPRRPLPLPWQACGDRYRGMAVFRHLIMTRTL
jgi:hypothetical protein